MSRPVHFCCRLGPKLENNLELRGWISKEGKYIRVSRLFCERWPVFTAKLKFSALVSEVYCFKTMPIS